MCTSISVSQRWILCSAQFLVPDFRPAMEAYFDAVLALGRRVLRLLALALDLPPTWCATAMQKPRSCELDQGRACSDAVASGYWQSRCKPRVASSD